MVSKMMSPNVRLITPLLILLPMFFCPLIYNPPTLSDVDGRELVHPLLQLHLLLSTPRVAFQADIDIGHASPIAGVNLLPRLTTRDAIFPCTGFPFPQLCEGEKPAEGGASTFNRLNITAQDRLHPLQNLPYLLYQLSILCIGDKQD